MDAHARWEHVARAQWNHRGPWLAAQESCMPPPRFNPLSCWRLRAAACATLVLLGAASAATQPATDANAPPPRHPPPPEALNFCATAKAGAACSVTTMRGNAALSLELSTPKP